MADRVDLDALAALLRDSPGTWVADDGDYDGYVSRLNGPTIFRPGVNNGYATADAVATAALHNAAPALLAELRAARRVVEKVADTDPADHCAMCWLCEAHLETTPEVHAPDCAYVLARKLAGRDG